MNHFPFFLGAFPETAIALSRELGALIGDAERAALWQRALTLARHLEDIESLASEGCAPAVRAQYEHTIDEFIRTIPQNSNLWFCFGFEEYLRTALEDVIAYEALGEPFMPYGAKMLRCGAGNRITLTRTLDLVGYAHATKAQRKLVEAYIDHMVHGNSAGAPPGRMKYFRDEQDFRETMVTLMQKVYHKGKKDPKQSLIAELFLQQINSHPLADLSGSDIFRDSETNINSMVRHLQRLCAEYGLSWKKLQELAGISSKNTSR